MLHREYYDLKALNWFFRLMRSIPVSATNRREIVGSLKRARNELDNGHLVCIFAEGAISRTGRLLPFKRGFEKIVEGTNIPIVPLHLDQLWGSIFSFKDGRFFWKWPQRVPYPVTVSFGPPLPPTATASASSKCRPGARKRGDAVPAQRAGIAAHQVCPNGEAALVVVLYGRHDGNGIDLRQNPDRQPAALALGGDITVPTKSMVGILLPATVAGSLANIAVLLAGKVPVNLNFTAGAESMASAVSQCKITTIITSRLIFIESESQRDAGHGFRRGYTKNFFRRAKVRRPPQRPFCCRQAG